MSSNTGMVGLVDNIIVKMSRQDQSLNLVDCEASVLANHLLKHRFNNDGLATATFLLECTSTLPNAEAISAQLMGDDEVQDENDVGAKVNEQEMETIDESTKNIDLGRPLLDERRPMSMITPRASGTFCPHENGLEIETGKDDKATKFVIVTNDVEQMVVFPKPDDCRKPQEKAVDVILLVFHNESNIMFKGKRLAQVCMQPASGDANLCWEVMVKSFHLDLKKDVALVPHPSSTTSQGRYVFCSYKKDDTSTTTGGMPFVQCYQGVNDGVLYPMEEGLLFFKPPFFVPRSALHSIACGRGSGDSRYVDMTLTLDDDEKTLEFTNIHRDELQVLNDYIHRVLIPAMKKDTNEDDQEEEETVEQSTEETDDSTPLGKRKRTQRKASREARQATRAQMETRDNETDSDDDDERWDRHGTMDESEDEDESNNDEEQDIDAEEEHDDEDDENGNVEEEFFEDADSGTATESEDK